MPAQQAGPPGDGGQGGRTQRRLPHHRTDGRRPAGQSQQRRLHRGVRRSEAGQRFQTRPGVDLGRGEALGEKGFGGESLGRPVDREARDQRQTQGHEGDVAAGVPDRDVVEQQPATDRQAQRLGPAGGDVGRRRPDRQEWHGDDAEGDARRPEPAHRTQQVGRGVVARAGGRPSGRADALEQAHGAPIVAGRAAATADPAVLGVSSRAGPARRLPWCDRSAAFGRSDSRIGSAHAASEVRRGGAARCPDPPRGLLFLDAVGRFGRPARHHGDHPEPDADTDRDVRPRGHTSPSAHAVPDHLGPAPDTVDGQGRRLRLGAHGQAPEQRRGRHHLRPGHLVATGPGRRMEQGQPRPPGGRGRRLRDRQRLRQGAHFPGGQERRHLRLGRVDRR